MLVNIITAVAPILIALIGIIPTIKHNSKETQKTIESSNKSTETRLDKMQKTLDNHIREDEDDNARNRRYRILRFYDEMCEGRLHSESHFEDILDDIDEYEKYCEKHPDYKNNRGKLAMQYITNTYDKLKTKGGFLMYAEKGENDD